PAVSRQEASPMIPPPNTGGSQCRRIIAKACGVLLVPLLTEHRHPFVFGGSGSGRGVNRTPRRSNRRSRGAALSHPGGLLPEAGGRPCARSPPSTRPLSSPRPYANPAYSEDAGV